MSSAKWRPFCLGLNVLTINATEVCTCMGDKLHEVSLYTCMGDKLHEVVINHCCQFPALTVYNNCIYKYIKLNLLYMERRENVPVVINYLGGSSVSK